MPRKKGDHDGDPLPPAINEDTKKVAKPKDVLPSAIEVPAGLKPPDKKAPKP